MSRRIFGFLAALLTPIVAALGQPIPSDPRLVTGTLDNGLAYIVRQHANPPGRVHLLLHVSTGSLNETEKQRGIAHFTEHMAFNGSENFPPGSVIKLFESIGLTFGQHQNAHTSFDETSYILALPDTRPETLERGMKFLGDVALHLTMPEAEIENERQIILEERRSRLSGRQRVQDYWLEHVAPGSLLGTRIPIGVEETIKGVQRQDFLDYYTTWYTPSNMTMMVVADMETAPVVAQIKATFSAGAKKDRPRDQSVNVRPYDATRAMVASDAELTDARVEIIWVAPAEEAATTVPLLRRDMVDRIATSCFNKRIRQKVSEGKMSVQGGGAGAFDLFRAAQLSTITVVGEPAKWKQMLSDMCVELQRVHLHGFREQEVADARADILASTKHAVQTEATMNAQAMIEMWGGAVSAGVPITSAQQDLDLISEVLPSITVKDVNSRFHQLFDTGKPVTFSLQLPSNAEVPSEAQLVELGARALDVKPESEAEQARAATFMDTPPTPGKVVGQSTHDGSGVLSAWLSNNARVHYRFMDYKKDQVIVSIMVAGGEILETAENRGISQAAAVALDTPATSTFSSTAVRNMFTGKNVNVDGRPAPDAMLITVSGQPADLEHGLQLAHLMITDAVVEKPALDIWKEQIKEFAAARKLDVQLALSEVAARNLYPKGEPRLGLLEPEQADRHTAESATQWLRQIMSSGPIEVSIVGDISKERALELVERYIGSLPSRERVSAGHFDKLRKMERPRGPIVASKLMATTTDISILMSGFYGVEPKDLRDVRLMNMATKVLSSRAIQDIREKMQLAYGPQVISNPSAEYPRLGLVLFASTTDPRKVESLRAAVTSLYDTFAKDGPSEGEVETAHKQFDNTLETQMREPSYWATRLATLDFRGNRLDDVVGAVAAYRSFTAPEIREAFNRYYKPENRFEMWVSPEPKTPK